MEFRVWVRSNVEAALDACLTFDGASQVIANLYRDLRNPAATADARREDRDPVDAEAFHFQMFLQDGGWTHTLDFKVVDGWELDRLHVVEVQHTRGLAVR